MTKDTLLLPLLKSTFGDHRMYVMNYATCVANILKVHPALFRTAVVSCTLYYFCTLLVCIHDVVQSMSNLIIII